MKKKVDISTDELNLLCEEMEIIDRHLTLLNPKDPVENTLVLGLKDRQKTIAKAFQGNIWALKKLHHKKVSGFYQ